MQINLGGRKYGDLEGVGFSTGLWPACVPYINSVRKVTLQM